MKGIAVLTLLGVCCAAVPEPVPDNFLMSEEYDSQVRQRQQDLEDLKVREHRALTVGRNPGTLRDENGHRVISVGQDPRRGRYPAADSRSLKLQGVEGYSLEDLAHGQRAWQEARKR